MKLVKFNIEQNSTFNILNPQYKILLFKKQQQINIIKLKKKSIKQINLAYFLKL